MGSLLCAVIRVDKDKCVNCHKCIAVCPSKMCNNGAADYVTVNESLCIGCGACIDACIHGARSGIDDADAFFADLAQHKDIIVIVAPAAVVSFGGKDLELNGWLKSIGVKAVFDVSFGAELTTKSYIEYMKSAAPACVISQPCPALVTYIELYHPELLKYLAPADSPMLHTMRMIREYYPQYAKCRIAAISPCYAKRREFDETGMGDYNVTIRSLEKYCKEHRVDISRFPRAAYDNPEAERGVLYSTPGGLMRTAERFVPGISAQTRRIEGNPAVFDYFKHLSEKIQKGGKPLFKLVDCLNCDRGCNCGAGTSNKDMFSDDMEDFVEKRKNSRADYWKKQGFTKKTAYRRLDKVIDGYWKPELYSRKYVLRAKTVSEKIRQPSDQELQQIYLRMNETFLTAEHAATVPAG